MRNEPAENVKISDSPSELGILDRLKAFSQEHPNEVYVIVTEMEATELLMVLGLAMKKQAKTLSKPMVPTGGKMTPMMRRYNQKQIADVKAMGNKFVKAARSDSLAFCLEELNDTPLEFYGAEIQFAG